MLPVVQDALRRLEGGGDRFDAVCLLQATNPLRRSEDIDACVRLLEETGADCRDFGAPGSARLQPALGLLLETALAGST